ncbi:MAG: hypothetical protein ACRDJP_06595, partial [Actinomycetota bacterium]
MSGDTTTGFERAHDLAGAVVRPAGDGTLVELAHGGAAYSRFGPDAWCHVRVHDNGRRAVVVDLAEGDAWFDTGDAVIEVHRAGATIVADDGATVAVKSEPGGGTIVVAASGVVTLQPSDGERMELSGQAVMLDPEGKIGQIVEVSAEQLASEPWIARNRAVEPLPAAAAPEPEVQPETDAEEIEVEAVESQEIEAEEIEAQEIEVESQEIEV